ncbi:MAG: MurR/RpiR family transcriptional regulator [Anaerorhabdus sp.]
MNYLLTIEAYYDTLSRKEKIIADYIKENGSDIIYETLSDISKKLDVGEATIMRFCHKLKFSGFQDLKLEAAKVTSADVEPIAEGGLINTKATSTITALKATQLAITMEDLEKASEYIDKARSIFFFGVANSSIAAKSMELRLLRMGKVGHAVIDSHVQLISASVVDKHSLIIAFSLTGATKEIFDALKIAKINKAKIIVITNNYKSPIAKLSSLKFQTFGRETPLDGGAIEGQLSQMFVADYICSIYSKNNRENIRKQKEKTAEAIITRNIQ